MFKSRNLWANHHNFPPNQYGDRHRELPDYLDFLVRITHIMLKKRFCLTTPIKFGILAMLIRIEVYRASLRGTTLKYAEIHRGHAEVL